MDTGFAAVLRNLEALSDGDLGELSSDEGRGIGFSRHGHCRAGRTVRGGGEGTMVPAASTARTRAGLPGRRRDNSDAAFQRFGL